MSDSHDSMQMYDEMRLNVVKTVQSSSNTQNQAKVGKNMKYDVAATSDQYTERLVQNS